MHDVAKQQSSTKPKKGGCIMVDPALVGAAVTAVSIAAAAAYAYFSGDPTSVDVNDDGNAEVSFEGTDGEPGIADVQLDAEEIIDEADELLNEIQGVDELEDVKGIGPSRAEDLRDAGIESPADLRHASDDELLAIDGFGETAVLQIREDIGVE